MNGALMSSVTVQKDSYNRGGIAYLTSFIYLARNRPLQPTLAKYGTILKVVIERVFEGYSLPIARNIRSSF